ncbi:UTP--glucose-1-phosphate uridylyltransferase GalU [Finegoldia sp. BIOML-A3]|uniref:UTP--glucose-1-phosphate uridylyltransferase n=1 Tax=Finegoldia magna TaxID=1260 RepID=A0A233VIB2_FINMA|nr:MULTISPECIES: UTP--glucose-1-phosphate uridylyltransferase GalU [Finegoldia]MBS5360321.1 UTP--glucose-1-phosphate uridylyltransferase GalU [Finegoldia magna]MBS5965538.1 UTP--glucose-1-phosphate uridylyltransferase GalU [Finegoldia magna]MDU5960240.1 UTP--glucose-1-phosphate uridylyltransferase GalU [Finegoldia magna]MSA99601.1 UTP--glucose-1-phosphate uridylyltransferase GalU [Finegoldia sp. BIOML-A3]MSB92493.1 UTP--glucose-1-phosphate uridylyltransferase GalU [Finegoldia sp. BIOML-A4]
MKVRKAVIPAAGFGTRMLPASKSVPKEMLPIYDKPTLHHIVKEVVDSGITDILIIISKDKGSIEDYFDVNFELEYELNKKSSEISREIHELSKMANIYTIRQKKKNGLGDAIKYAESFVGGEPFAILLGDDIIYNTSDELPCIKQMADIYEKEETPVLGVQEVSWDDVDKYGIVNGVKTSDRITEVESLVEKPSREEATTNLAILGRYIVTPDIFPILHETKPGKNNEIQLTDALNKLAEKRKMIAYDFIGKRYDVGNKLGFVKATVDFALHDEKIKDELLEFLREK